MNILEVYALNIQPAQIAKRLGCKRDDKEVIEIERGNFLKFLQERAEDGILYPNQLHAWNVYDSSSILDIYTEDDLEYLFGSDYEPRDYLGRQLQTVEVEAVDFDDEKSEWIAEIKALLLEQAIKLGVRDVDMDNLYYTRLHE